MLSKAEYSLLNCILADTISLSYRICRMLSCLYMAYVLTGLCTKLLMYSINTIYKSTQKWRMNGEWWMARANLVIYWSWMLAIDNWWTLRIGCRVIGSNPIQFRDSYRLVSPNIYWVYWITDIGLFAVTTVTLFLLGQFWKRYHRENISSLCTAR